MVTALATETRTCCWPAGGLLWALGLGVLK